MEALFTGILYYLIMVLAIARSPVANVNWIIVIIFLMAQVLQFASISITSRVRGPQMRHVPLADLSILHRYVLCPHFLAEFIIYAVFGHVSGWNPIMTVNFVFVLLNQASAAAATRKWYLRSFPRAKYRPKALIPLIF